MIDFNIQNKDGDLALHCLLRKTFGGGDDARLLKKFLDLGSNVHIRNNDGRSVLHEAVKFSSTGVRAIELLLQKGACVNAIDNEGSSILHDVFKNPIVNMEMVKTLLRNGAYPDSRDHENKPPLAYVQTSQLSAEDKSTVSKLLIQITIIRKYNKIKKNQQSVGEDILCLNFCRDNPTIHDQLCRIRQGCLSEIMELDNHIFDKNYSIFNLLFDYCTTADSNRYINRISLEKIIYVLSSHKYPYFQDLILCAIKHCNFDNILKKVLVFAVKSSCDTVNTNVVLNNECVLHVSSKLEKIDFINLIVAFWNKSVANESKPTTLKRKYDDIENK